MKKEKRQNEKEKEKEEKVREIERKNNPLSPGYHTKPKKGNVTAEQARKNLKEGERKHKGSSTPDLQELNQSDRLQHSNKNKKER